MMALLKWYWFMLPRLHWSYSFIYQYVKLHLVVFRFDLCVVRGIEYIRCIITRRRQRLNKNITL